MPKLKTTLVNSLLDLNEGLQTTSSLSLTILMLCTYLFHTMTLLNFKSIGRLLAVSHNRILFDTALYFLISVNFFFLLLIGVNLTLKSSKVSQKMLPLKTILMNFSYVALISFISIYSNIIMPMKTLVYLLRLFVIPRIDKNSSVVGLILNCWIVGDWFLTLVVNMLKYSYLRSLGGHLGASGVGNSSSSSDIWGKMQGYSEEVVEVGFIIFALFTTIVSGLDDNTIIFYVFYILRLLTLAMMNIIYLRELPFFNKLTEKLYGHLLFLFTMFYIVYGATEDDLTLTMKIWVVIIPFQILCYEFFLKKAYSSDYLDRSKKKSMKVIKRILVDGHGFGSVEEKLFDGGILKNYLVSGKSINKSYLKIWKSMVSLKSKLSAQSMERNNNTDTNLLLQDSSDNPQDDKNSQDLNTEIKKIYNQIDNLILTEFIREKNRSSYSQFLKIIWLLKNDTILSEVFRGLTEMSNKRNSFKSIFLYHYAKRQVSSTLSGFYY